MKIKKFIVFASIGVLALFVYMILNGKQYSEGFKIQEGDLLFQDGDCGSFCEAIKKVTFGVDGHSFSHIGVVKKGDDGGWLVLEAISDGVVLTLLDTFLSRSRDAVGNPKVVVGRLKDEFIHIVPAALKHGEKYLGKPYDHVFDIENDAYYCSELIYFIFKEANQSIDVFHLEPMTFIDPDTGKLFPIWEKYYERLGVSIPEKAPGLNPGNISRSEKLIIMYPYSSFF